MIRISSTVRRALLLLAVLGVLGVPVAHAQEPTTTAVTTKTGEEPPPPPPPLIPEKVTVSGVLVGGLTGSEATAALRAFFWRPLTLTFRARERDVGPAHLGASPRISAAVTAALAAAPGDALELGVRIRKPRLNKYVARLTRAWARPARNSVVLLRDLRPYITRARSGYRIRQRPARYEIRRTFALHQRGPLALPSREVRPSVTRRNFGPVLVIRRGSRGLYLYSGASFRHYFPVAVGLPQYPTPLGRFSIVSKQRNPWWYPPDSGWAAGASPIPPGPLNPLGTRWMGLSARGVGIHGTPNAASIGYSASHGCIRMRIPDAEWLFEHVRVGTTVFIVSA